MRRTIRGFLLLSATIGCSSQANTQSGQYAAAGHTREASEATRGDEVSVDTERPIPAADSPTREQSSGPGTVTLLALIDGKPVPAAVRVFDSGGTPRSEAATGTPITLASGDYRVEVSVTDPTVMADKPTQTRELSLRAGQHPQLEYYFRWAKISLNVLVGGRPTPGARVKLLREGQVVAELQSGAAPVAITPGRYEADVQLRGSVVRVKGLQFPEGATQTVPVRAQF